MVHFVLVINPLQFFYINLIIKNYKTDIFTLENKQNNCLIEPKRIENARAKRLKIRNLE